MRYVDDLPHEVDKIEHVFIPMRDGVKLGARLWLPKSAAANPVSAVLEYIPYRKRDLTRHRDSGHHPYFAGHGFASIRVDLRGSGDSEGVLEDEYLESELADGEDVLRWIASQPWCNGRVGIIGISWGGFNGLQIAARRPPELHAVITLSSTDDRYSDDVHYMGGCLLGDNLSWASAMFERNACPPDPEVVGDAWRSMWMQRLEGSGLWVEKWLEHQRRDAYWRHGSICEDYSAIQCPVMAVSGWADGYSNAVFRLLENLDVPRRGLIGPWSHRYPHVGMPGPAIGFLQECVRWWRKWLDGEENEALSDPMLRVWMQESVPPFTSYQERPGRWVAEPSWPSDAVKPLRYRLTPPKQLVSDGTDVPERRLTIQSPLTLGLFAGKWCSYAFAPDLPYDQREEDGGALVFDTGRLEEVLEILGAPTVTLEVSANRPVAMVAVRLSDVAQDGKATRVTYGIKNLTHRTSDADPEPLAPNTRYRVEVDLNGVAYRFPKGHKLRLSISTSYWPLAWPPPTPVCLSVYTGASSLALPARAPRPEDAELRPMGPPESARPCPRTQLEPRHYNWLLHRDLATEESVLEVIHDHGRYRLDEIDIEIEAKTVEKYRSVADDFDSIQGEVTTVRRFHRGDWSVRMYTRTVLTSTSRDFCIRAELDAYEGDTRVFCESWDRRIPRDLV